ncbi:MAG: mechanosensitive ion channel family protein [Erysipelotrichaceae bacterium]|nr:mechanosensitive ion channel family protein [Erysipelotrichaceae bacterium]
MDLNWIYDFGSEVFNDGLVFFIIQAVVVLVIARMLSRAFSKLTKPKLAQNNVTSAHFAAKFIKATIWVVAIIIILSGIKPLKAVSRTMIGASGILTVFFGLWAQESFSNLISGFFLSLYHPFMVGDLVRVKANGIDEEIIGYVKEINLRHTILSNFWRSDIIVPNSIMNTAIVENRAHHNTTSVQPLYIGISYDSDIKLAKELITKVCRKHPDFMGEKVMIRCVDLGDFAVKLRIDVVGKDFPTVFSMMCDLREQIKASFDENGVVIPFPVRTVITKNETK